MVRDITAEAEVREAFIYLYDDLFSSIVSGSSFDTFNRLTFERYTIEEYERYIEIGNNFHGESFYSQVLSEAREYYDCISEEFHNLKLEYSEEMDEELNDKQIFDIALSIS